MKTLYNFLFLAILGTSAANASITFMIDSPDQSGLPGDTIQFFGSVYNTGPDTVYLNSDSLSLAMDPSDYTVTDYFFTNYPVSLDADQGSGDIELFDITLSDPFAESSGLYQGTISILGGDDGNAQDILASADFSVTVDAVSPEPSTAVLMCGALALLLGRKEWIRRFIR